jgi:tetratricopeptide (TPR) repeat protein
MLHYSAHPMGIAAKNLGKLIIAFALCLPAVQAADDATSTDLFATASAAFTARDFAHSAELLEQLLLLQPECAECAHLLGRAYGHMAEQATWSRAIGLAKKTRVALENAVNIDPSNAPAIEDLIRYYRQAPGFLGGNNAKATELEQRLRRLQSELAS